MKRPRPTSGGAPQVEPRDAQPSDFAEAIDRLRAKESDRTPFERGGRNRVSGELVKVAEGLLRRRA